MLLLCGSGDEVTANAEASFLPPVYSFHQIRGGYWLCRIETCLSGQPKEGAAILFLCVCVCVFFLAVFPPL